MTNLANAKGICKLTIVWRQSFVVFVLRQRMFLIMSMYFCTVLFCYARSLRRPLLRSAALSSGWRQRRKKQRTSTPALEAWNNKNNDENDKQVNKESDNDENDNKIAELWASYNERLDAFVVEFQDWLKELSSKF